MVWTNGLLNVYHGTTDTEAGSIRSLGPQPSMGRGVADFGQGFYVTTDLHQARQWANQKVRVLSAGSHIATVVQLQLDRDILSRYRDHLSFVLANSDFYDFVSFNRLGSTAHGRISKKPYDIVYGPVCAFPQQMFLGNADQICFTAFGKLGATNALNRSGIVAKAPTFINPTGSNLF